MIGIEAPAKINLGLEILHRREDGYHEIRTVLTMIDVCDRLVFRESENPGINVQGMPIVRSASNLIVRAFQALELDVGSSLPGCEVSVEKRIPYAAGLGGGSSDAAATLIALSQLFSIGLERKRLDAIARCLGADVPFFLPPTTSALASGIGTDLDPLPSPSGALVVATPQITIEAKTRRLYDALTPDDWTSGEAVERVASDLVHRQDLHDRDLPNAFSRPLMSLTADMLGAMKRVRHVTGVHVSLTGSGPTLFALIEDEERASQAAETLTLDPRFRFVAATSFRAEPIRAVEL